MSNHSTVSVVQESRIDDTLDQKVEFRDTFPGVFKDDDINEDKSI
jgi:hypothetical protein